MRDGYYTTAEATEYLGIPYHTMTKYAGKFGIKPERVGRTTFYRCEDIERINKALADRVPFLIDILQRLTGMEVTFTQKK